MSSKSSEFQAVDSQFRYGQIAYTLDQVAHSQRWSEKHRFLFRSDGSFRDTVLSTTRKNTLGIFGSSYEIFESGPSNALVYTPPGSSSRVAVIGPGGPIPEIKNSESSIMPYPCKVLGLGFSQYPTLSRGPNGARTFEAPFPGETLQFLPEPAHPLQPATLTHLRNGKPEFRYEYSKYRKVLPGIDLPTVIDLHPVDGMASQRSSHYVITSIDLSKEPSLEDITAPWFSASTPLVRDYRVTPDVAWKYATLLKLNGKSSDLSLDQLYKWSQQRARADEVYYKMQASAASKVSHPPSRLGPLPIAVGALSVAVIAWVTYKRSRAIGQGR